MTQSAYLPTALEVAARRPGCETDEHGHTMRAKGIKRAARRGSKKLT
ncbi:hypothetical protein [Candidatus Regiella insecticola]|nr:hypothetical protein [Candidatus Regiella insecticola]